MPPGIWFHLILRDIGWLVDVFAFGFVAVMA